MAKKLPDFLGEAGRMWARKILREYAFSGSEFDTMIMAAETLDRLDEARKDIAARGITVLDRYRVSKINPSAVLERDQKLLFSRLCKTLGLYGEETEKKQ